MPLIIVWNLNKANRKKIKELEKALEKTVIAIPELDLEEGQVEMAFPEDSSVPKDAMVSIVVELLFDKPERTPEIRQWLANTLRVTFKGFVTDQKVEVAVKRFDPKKDAFSSD